MKNFSILLPTRNRSALVKRLFDSLIDNTSDTKSLEIVVWLDEDDPESQKISCTSLSVTKLIMPRGNMRDFIRTCYEKSIGRYIALMNDDVVFRTKNWDVKVLEAFRRFADDLALVYGNDLYYGKKLATFPIFSRTACEFMDRMHLPPYKSHSVDSHIFDIFERLSQKGYKRLAYLPEVIFEHMNYGVTTSAYDAGSSKINHHEDDHALYLALGDERQRIADRMAEYIESYAKKLSKTSQPLISVIMQITADTSRNATSSAINAIYNDNKSGSIDFEIIIISADPAKDALQIPKDVKNKVTVIRYNDTNIAKAFNKGAAAANGEYIIFLKSGTTFETDWLGALVEAANDEEVGIVGSRWLNPRNGRIEHIGISFFDDNGTIKDTCIYKGFPSNHPAVSKKREFQAVKTAGMLIKKDIFLGIKGFDEDLGGAEGIDLCLKVRRLGKRVVCSPRAVLYYCEQEIAGKGGRHVPADLLHRLKGEVECDLEKLLAEDGFSLCLNGKTRYIAPKVDIRETKSAIEKERVESTSLGR